MLLLKSLGAVPLESDLLNNSLNEISSNLVVAKTPLKVLWLLLLLLLLMHSSSCFNNY